MRTSGAASNHFLKPGSVPYEFAVSYIRTPLANDCLSSLSSVPASLNAPVPISRTVISTPVLPIFLFGNSAGFASCPFTPPLAPITAAVASAPACKNVRRSVPLISSCDIALDSSLWGVRPS